MKLPGLIPCPVPEICVSGREAFLLAADHALAMARDMNRSEHVAKSWDEGVALHVALLACAVVAANLRAMARASCLPIASSCPARLIDDSPFDDAVGEPQVLSEVSGATLAEIMNDLQARKGRMRS